MERVFCLLLLVVAACGTDDGDPPESCSEETRAEEFKAGISKQSADNYQIILEKSEPQMLVRGDHTWTFSIRDQAGAPVSGLTTVKLDPDMPDHGHGTPKVAQITEIGDTGQYEASPVNLWMAGYWEVVVALGDDVPNEQTVTYKVCVD